MTRRFTGWHMLGVLLAMFGTVIAVNFVMATIAIRTFGGTVVDNSYIASQEFNRWLAQARSQKQLGWTIEVGADGRHRPIVLLHMPPYDSPAIVSATAIHPLGRAAARTLGFVATGPGRFVATEALPPGRWLLRIAVRRGGRTALFDDAVRA